jgi:hypothetical protein
MSERAGEARDVVDPEVVIVPVVPGRATRQGGVVHLVLLAASVFLAVNP